MVNILKALAEIALFYVGTKCNNDAWTTLDDILFVSDIGA